MALDDMVAIVIQGKEWHDRAAGQHYCSSHVYTISSDGTVRLWISPFQLGYDDAYIQYAFEKLADDGAIRLPPRTTGIGWCYDNNVRLLAHKCKATKKETMRWGQG